MLRAGGFRVSGTFERSIEIAEHVLTSVEDLATNLFERDRAAEDSVALERAHRLSEEMCELVLSEEQWQV